MAKSRSLAASPETTTACEVAVDELKVKFNEICGRLARLETKEKVQECSAKEVSKQQDNEGQSARHGRAVFLMHESKHLTTNDSGFLGYDDGKRKWHENLVILYISYRDGTYNIKSLRNGNILQRQDSGKLFFGNYDDPENFYIEKSDATGPFILRCKENDALLRLSYPSSSHFAQRRIRLEGLSIVPLQE